MKFFVGLTTLVSLALAAPSKAPTPLDVKLEKIGNSQVKATVTNNGKNALKLFKSGTLLDSVANEKAIVSAGCKLLSIRNALVKVNVADPFCS
jgi:deuterolysin